MPRPPKLSEAEVARRLAALPGWSLHDGSLHRELAFANFPAAWAFMSRIALEAERMGHHPDWCNSGNRVVVELQTHDVGGVTELDFALAEHIQAVAPAAEAGA
jgi:4a-hydroxytetrahydrobiopterin dehydratase